MKLYIDTITTDLKSSYKKTGNFTYRNVKRFINIAVLKIQKTTNTPKAYYHLKKDQPTNRHVLDHGCRSLVDHRRRSLDARAARDSNKSDYQQNETSNSILMSDQ